MLNNRATLVLFCALVLGSFQQSSALNAKHVTYVTPANKVVLSTISGTTIIHDTLTNIQIECPQFSFDGKKFACWKIQSGKWYLSVMDLASRTFADLIDCAAWGAVPTAVRGVESITWPAGDWIYIEKPSYTGEIWKINVLDPSQKVKICGYNQLKSGYRLFYFYVTPDVRLGLATLGTISGSWNSYQPIHTFPPAGDPTQAPNFIFNLPNCNPALSPSGAWAERFWNGMHQQMVIYQWNTTAKTYDVANVGVCNSPNTSGCIETTGDLEAWSGRSGWICVLEGPAWAVNSDRWMTVRTSLPSSCDGFETGSNAIAFSWKDKQTLDITGHVAGKAALTGGSLFVEGGPANCYQDVNGNWFDNKTHAQVVVAAGSADPAPRVSAHTRILNANGVLHIAANTSGAHTVSILDVFGRCVRTLRGTGLCEYAIAAKSLGAGVCFVKVQAGRTAEITRIVARQASD